MSSTKHIYVVDADPSARSGISRLLLKAGYDARSFASIDEFLDALDPESAGCLVLDAGLPEPSGEELQTALETRGFQAPIIFITADDDSGSRQKARKLKAIAFFRKPVDGKALLDIVEWALR